jgi:hypothetical protein
MMLRRQVIALTLLLSTPAGAVTAIWNYSISPQSSVTLDSTIFTGSNVTPDPFYDGTTFIANVTGCPCTLGGADVGKFQIDNVGGGQALNGGWHVGSAGEPGARVGPFLTSKGNVAGGTGSGPGGTFLITINGTPFTLGDPPYTPKATIVHVASGVNPQSAINAASSGTTVVLDAGSHSGSFSAKDGVDVVSATKQNPMFGQTARATVDGGGGQIGLASNSEMYGITFTNLGGGEAGAFPFNGSSNSKFINNIFNGPGDVGNSQVGICQNGGSGDEVSWNTFNNFAGNDNNCGNSDNYLNSHNALHWCQRDCEGGDFTNHTGIQYIDNFADRPGQNCNGCGTASYLENVGTGGTGIIKIKGNWISYADGVSHITLFSLSVIAAGTNETAYNYFVNDANINSSEWDNHISEPGKGGYTSNNHDNYFDGTRTSGHTAGFDAGPGFFGPYGSGTVETNSRETNNNEIPNVNDSCDFASMPCAGVLYIKGTSIDYGVLPAFAAGAGP